MKDTNILNVIDVNTRANITKKFELTHLELVALSFVLLAGKSSFFKEWLRQRLLDHNLVLLNTAGFSKTSFEYIEWVPSINPAVAEQKLLWLFNEIECIPRSKRQGIIKILNLAYRNPIPKMVAWGFVFVETLGVFVAGHPFSVNQCVDYSQDVILGPGWQLLKSQKLTRQVSRASLMTLNKCIEEACFSLERLEPEVGSWLTEGSGVRLYEAKSNQDFKNIHNQICKSGLPFALASEEVDILALQPCITGSYDTLLAELVSLQ